MSRTGNSDILPAMLEPVADWAREAATLPVAFAQVREDPRIDRWVVERAGDAVRIGMIASGGCTATVLATLPRVASIQFVDPNNAQLALVRLKLRLLATAPPATRRAVLGHAAMPPEDRRGRLATELAALELPDGVLGLPETVAELGPDFAGRYERCFAALQKELAAHRTELDAVLALSASPERARRVSPETQLGKSLDKGLDTVMSLPNLVALFGEGATRNPVEPFSRHFARRIRIALATLPAANNSFLGAMLRGIGEPDWLSSVSPSRLPTITWLRAFMSDALRAAEPGAFDVVHLSNILDWISPEEAAGTLDAAARALRVGGWIIVRQLNSTLDVPACGPMFDWDRTAAADLHAADRSFFYRELHLGRKR
jgi:S-adenosylmethionine-diacylglycerol 3-amino-3-carboxypropyl transferase